MSAAAVTKAEFIATCKSGSKNGGPALRAMIQCNESRGAFSICSVF